MNARRNPSRRLAPWRLVAGLVLACGVLMTRAAEEAPPPYQLIAFEGTVEVLRAGAGVWDRAYTNQVLLQGDQLRTGDHSRAVIRWSDLTLERLGERSRIQIPKAEEDGAVIEFFRGILYFFHRDQPGEFDIRTPRAAAVVRGTEFVLEVEEDGTTRLALIDGEVELTNAFGALRLESGDQAVVLPDAAPRRTAVLAGVRQLQWNLYYPAVLDPDELHFDDAEAGVLQASLEAYRRGDLLAALARHPGDAAPRSPLGTVYRAALVLAVGDVAESRTLLNSLAAVRPEADVVRMANALEALMAAVSGEEGPLIEPLLASEWMARSYQAQAATDLPAARAAVREALGRSPGFAFAQARAGELAFGFGEVREAQRLVTQSLATAPRNAQAHALRGFLLAADDRLRDAITAFNEAIAIDSALGNAWLGRGLCRLRLGESRGGLDDLQVAATVEPQRALPRSYLGKAYSTLGDNGHALQELDLARRLDPGDPTAWLYGALVRQEENRINEAVSDLETSQARNGNRGLYRSRLLLDEDRAIRSANLARVYADAGLEEVALWEAARGVTAEYANYSSHLFLANSYSERLDPGRVTIRYETAAVSEYLLANLLSPVGAGTLSPTVSQNEYGRLFDRDGPGIVSSTEYLSRGAWRQEGAVYGTYGGTSAALETFYVHDNGQTRNGDLEVTSLSARIKQRLTAQDHLFGQVLWSQAESGDVAPHYNPNPVTTPGVVQGVNPYLRAEEEQEPILLAGYHHEWSPGNHSLLLASRLESRQSWDDPIQPTLLVDKTTGATTGASLISMDQDYHNELEIYSAEAQQILERGRHTLIAGGRWQGGGLDSHNVHTPTAGSTQPAAFFTDLTQDVDSDFERASLYAYYQYRLLDPLLLVGGASYDYLKYPANFRFAPPSDDEETLDQISPKAGLVWTPGARTTVRAGYSRSLGGVSFDQSFRIEPSQVAGINQAYRSVIPDAVTGANAGEAFDVFGLAWDQTFPTRTYAGLVAHWMESDVDREVGVYDATPPAVGVFPLPPFIYPGETSQSLDYEETSLALTLSQLVADEWSFGVRYRLTRSDLDIEYRDLRGAGINTIGFSQEEEWTAFLHEVRLFGVFNHPCGFFARGEALWFQQSNQGYNPDIPGDDFWQFNLLGGYRFLQRRMEVTVGVLNLADQDYRLNPLNVTSSLPRDRTFYTRLRFSF